MSDPAPRPARLLLKLSGEALAEETAALSPRSLAHLVTELASAREQGAELGVVVGAGNLVRGQALAYLERTVADQMGMTATVINALALRDSLHQAGLPARALSAIASPWLDLARPDTARDALAQGSIVIFAGGTGHPFVTTDTAAAIRAAEIGADALAKASTVDGIYTGDPATDATAERLPNVSFRQAIEDELGVMDLAALAICRQQRVPIAVYDHTQQGALQALVRGERIGSWITPQAPSDPDR